MTFEEAVREANRLNAEQSEYVYGPVLSDDGRTYTVEGVLATDLDWKEEGYK